MVVSERETAAGGHNQTAVVTRARFGTGRLYSRCLLCCAGRRMDGWLQLKTQAWESPRPRSEPQH